MRVETVVWIFPYSRINTDHELAEAASGTGSLILSKTCKSHKSLKLVNCKNRGNLRIRGVILMITPLL